MLSLDHKSFVVVTWSYYDFLRKITIKDSFTKSKNAILSQAQKFTQLDYDVGYDLLENGSNLSESELILLLMKRRYPLLLATLVTGIVMSLLQASVYGEQSVYVYDDELPPFADYAGNVMYEATKAWEDQNPGLKFYKVSTPQDADFVVKWVKEFGTEYVGYAYGNQFIEVGLGDSNCGGKWNPYSSNYVAFIMKHEIGHIFGHQHSSDPNSLMYPIAFNKEYGLVEEEFTLTERYAQFVPFCTFKDVTSYYYQITTDDQVYGFAVYVVPSVDSFYQWKDGKSFKYYSDSDCFGENYLSYGGTCEGITKDGGLLIILDNKQTQGLTRITVKQQELPLTQNFVQPTETKPPSEIFPETPPQTQPYLPFNSIPEYTTPSYDDTKYKDVAYAAKSVYESKIDLLKSGITEAEKALSGLKFENPDAQKKVEQAWDVRWKAVMGKTSAEKKLGDALSYLNDESYESAYLTFKTIDSDSEAVGINLKWISAAIEDAKNMEKEYKTQNQKPKFCFLFWCW